MACAWEYYRSQRSPDVWTVTRFNGFRWIDDSDHATCEDAAARVAALNDGRSSPSDFTQPECDQTNQLGGRDPNEIPGRSGTGRDQSDDRRQTDGKRKNYDDEVSDVFRSTFSVRQDPPRERS